MVSTEARAEIEKMFANKQEEAKRYPEGKPLTVSRREWEAAARLAVLPKGARFQGVEAAGVSCEWMEMPHVSRDRVVLQLHGGGYNSGSPKTHRKLGALLSRAAYARVLTPDYRLAPEDPFPAGVTDALKTYGWLLEQGFKERNILIAGDSAGGGLALSMLLALRDAKATMPLAALLLSPWTDLTCSTGSYERLRKLDPLVNREVSREAGRWYAGERDPADPMLSPLFADLSGLPPLLVHVGGDEVMLDDSRLLAERARHAGVEVAFRVYEGMWHGHHHAAPEIPEAQAAMHDIAAFIRAQFGE